VRKSLNPVTYVISVKGALRVNAKKVRVTVCCHCREGGNKLGGLRKLNEYDYAHDKCYLQFGLPKIGNRSFMMKDTYEEKTDKEKNDKQK
jgi:hypothetical protein